MTEMANKKGTGLMMVYADIPADKEEEFNRWYNEEHIDDVMAMPGFLNAARYVAVSGGPKYLACYELESPGVVNSPEHKGLLANPTEWAAGMAPMVIGENYSRIVYRQIFPGEVTQEVTQSDMAPALQLGRQEIPSETEDEFNEWYNTVYVPNFETVPGCIRGRRYVAVEGGPKYGTVYELQHENVTRGPEWTAVRDAPNPQTARIRPQIQRAPGTAPGIYKKIFQM